MSSLPGSCEHAADVAARALLERGATNLEAKIGAHVASFGDQCWQTDGKIREIIHRPDGRPYHVESIGRARRAMARAGWLISLRIFTGQKAPGARRVSAHGTTSKSLRWSVLNVTNPLTRGERRKARIAAGEKVAPLGDPPMRPRYSAPPPPLDFKLAAVVGELASALAPRWRAAEASPGPVSVDELDATLAVTPPE